MEVEIVKGVQTIRNPFFDWFFSLITNLGDELFFILLAVIMFWCVNKRFGYKIINVYLIGTSCIEGLKALVAHPRPYTHDGIVSVGKETAGYSFPSGHSHSISNLCAQMANNFRIKWTYIAYGVIVALVGFSRIYLGQHFLSDVIAGIALGTGFALAFSFLFELLGEKEEYLVIGVLPLCVIITIVLWAVGATGNAYKVLGAYSAISLGYYIEKKYIKLNVQAKWYIQIVKIVIGLALTLGVKEGLKLILPADIPVLYSFLRYFMVGAVASVGACGLFKLCRFENKPVNHDEDGQDEIASTFIEVGENGVPCDETNTADHYDEPIQTEQN